MSLKYHVWILIFLATPMLGQEAGQTWLTLGQRDPLLNIFSYDPGALSLSEGQGIVGSYLNPAALTQAPGPIEGFLGISFSRHFTKSATFTLVHAEDYPYLNQDLDLQINLDYEDQGGIDFIGGSAAFRGWRWGIGIFPSTRTKIQAQGISDLNQSMSFDSIPTRLIVGEDSLQVTWSVTGWGRAFAESYGTLEIERRPIFLRAAKNLGIFSIGFGYDLEVFQHRANLHLQAYGALDSLYAVVNDAIDLGTGQPITVVTQLNTQLQDTLLKFDLTGSGSSIRHGLGVGFQARLGILSFGLVGRMWTPFHLGDPSIKGQTILAAGIPDSVIYPPAPEYRNDTLFLIGDLAFGNLLKDTLEMFKHGTVIEIPTTYGLGLGVTAGVLHVSASIQLSPAARFSYGRWWAESGVILPLPLGQVVASIGQATEFLLDGKGNWIPLHVNGILGVGASMILPSQTWLGIGFRANLLGMGLTGFNIKTLTFERPDLKHSWTLSLGLRKTIGG